jgi:hypothetical protein
MPANPSYGEDQHVYGPVESCELPDGIQLVYADDRDRQRTISLEEAALLDFGRVEAFRTPSAYRAVSAILPISSTPTAPEDVSVLRRNGLRTQR